jgi:hypothetical protein
MDGSQIRRLGLWLVAAAIAIALASPYLPARLVPAQGGNGLATALGVIGVSVVAIGFLLESSGRKTCPRCGRAAVSGSVFCAAHRKELLRTTREVAARSRRDNRLW